MTVRSNSLFNLPERLVIVVTLADGKTKEKTEGKIAYAERCDVLLRDEVLRCALLPEAIYQIRITRFGMRLDFNQSTAEALFLALPAHVSAWCTAEHAALINWTKVAVDINTIAEVGDLL
jgi:hypothetical protein